MVKIFSCGSNVTERVNVHESEAIIVSTEIWIIDMPSNGWAGPALLEGNHVTKRQQTANQSYCFSHLSGEWCNTLLIVLCMQTLKFGIWQIEVSLGVRPSRVCSQDQIEVWLVKLHV